jgi:S-methylmethionine-dependent homocysteine/selenocysteine methylase
MSGRFEACFNAVPALVMEGAVGERLKREKNIVFDEQVALAGLVYSTESAGAMRSIFREYLSIAEKYRLPFMATTPTRRANRERVTRSGLGSRIIEDNVRFLDGIRDGASTAMFVGGMLGCRGDAYKATDPLSREEARDFHAWQAELFWKAGVDFLFAAIMPTLPEAAGMAQAMEATGLPYLISFMIRKNGRLIDGTTIHDAITAIDGVTERKPLCYMTNCVHPLIVKSALEQPCNATALVMRRFKGIQANASSLSPEELDGNCDLQSSDGATLAGAMMELRRYCDLKIFGGCCGTDASHIEEIAQRLSH